MRRKLLFIVALMLALVVSVTTWTQTNATQSVNITAGGDGGKLANVIGIGEAFTIVQGKGANIQHVELYKIEVGDAQLSHQLRIRLLNANIDAVLEHPKANILVQLYYPGTGSKQVTLDSDGTIVIPDNGPRAKAMINPAHGEVVLTPSVTGQSTFYVLADIHKPPKVTRNESLTPDLRFNCDVSLGGGVH